MSKVKYIEVGFENFESILIPVERIESFSYGNLTEIERRSKAEECYSSDKIELKISYQNKSELQYSSMKETDVCGMYKGNPLSNNVEDRPHILGRLIEFRDITDIQLLDEDKNPIQVIYVPWDEVEECTNDLMKVKAENGILEIEIKESKGE